MHWKKWSSPEEMVFEAEVLQKYNLLPKHLQLDHNVWIQTVTQVPGTTVQKPAKINQSHKMNWKLKKYIFPIE